MERNRARAMIKSHNRKWIGKPLLCLAVLLLAIGEVKAYDECEQKDVPGLRRWESTGIVNCTVPKFACYTDQARQLPLSKRCDGYADCTDSSDEKNCTECRTPYSIKVADGFLKCFASYSIDSDYDFTVSSQYSYPRLSSCVKEARDMMRENWKSGCADGELRCSIGPTCLRSSSVCDGVVDCNQEYSECHGLIGGEDENNCTECRSGARMCSATGKCIQSKYVCDGDKDCPDGSDEKDCPCQACTGAVCGNGQCIDAKKVCDGVIDCKDASDEQDCTTSCGAVVTANTTLPTIINDYYFGRYYKSEACSGVDPDRHCPNGECDRRVSFRCDNGRCISKAKVCDGVRDCADGADEKNCLKACLKYPFFTCVNYLRVKCMTMDAKCDGVRDCQDGSDEKKCDRCPSDAHRCNGGCISGTKRCDGVRDCWDGSDEMNCSCEECMSGRMDTYSCEATGKCLKRTAACGPKSRCPNPTARDELFCARQQRGRN